MPLADVCFAPRWRRLLRATGGFVVFCGAAAPLPLSAAAHTPGGVGVRAVVAVAPTAFAVDARASKAPRAAVRRTAKARTTKRARRIRTAKTARRGTAMLRGSKTAVDQAYRAAKRDGLTFARSRREIERGARAGDYVRLSRSTANYRLRGVTMPYVRPATRAFVAHFGANYRRSCGEALTVTSAMRPTSMHLANSVEKTVHPTGMAVDLRVPRRPSCRAWMRTALIGLERQGVVNATEERRPAHFHVVVYRAP